MSYLKGLISLMRSGDKKIRQRRWIMVKELKRPSEPNKISEVSFNEPFRLLRSNTISFVGMRVGNAKKNVTLLIDGGGTIKTVGRIEDVEAHFTFVDYLLEDESFTVFGSSPERSDDIDLGPDPAMQRALVVPKKGSSDFSGIPNWTPFSVRNAMRGPMWVVFGDDTKTGGRRALYVGQNSKTPMTSFLENEMEGRGDTFHAMEPIEELARFKRCDELKDLDYHPF